MQHRTQFTLRQELRISVTQVGKCIKLFCESILSLYEKEWLHRPTVKKLEQIEKRYRSLGFSGCIGAVDCTGWQRKSRPIKWQVLFGDKDEKPSCRVKVICDDNLQIWNLNFVVPGLEDYRTILEPSEFFNDMRSKKWTPILFDFVLERYYIRTLYYLVDGIYPRLLTFALRYPDSRPQKQRSYSARHSSARKAIARVFGVLYRQFKIQFNCCRLQCVKEMRTVVKTCCILHNVIVDTRGYEETKKFTPDIEESDDFILNLKKVLKAECKREQAMRWWQEFVNIESALKLSDLMDALVEHMWSKSGGERSRGSNGL